MSNKSIFLRNDDVRNVLDDSLINLTQLCIDYRIPISHAVEPGNVSGEVVEWLLEKKSKYPKYIEIIQHGYNHNLKNPSAKMEFGGNRTYDDQFQDIEAGKRLMDLYFNKHWEPVFTFPYGTFNSDSLIALNNLGYKAISTKIDFSVKNQVKNKIGRLLKSDFILNKKISYHPGRRHKYQFKEISVSANLIKKYIDDNNAVHYSKDEVLTQIQRASGYTNIIGILFHHRFHATQINEIDVLFSKLKERYKFSTIMELIR